MNKSVLNITPASFQEAMSLKRAVVNALGEKKFSIGALDLKKAMATGTVENNELLDIIMTPALSLLGSKEIEHELMTCASRATYNNQKVNDDFFVSIENRELYFPIMIEVLKTNLSPFFKGLFSGLGTIIESLSETQE